MSTLLESCVTLSLSFSEPGTTRRLSKHLVTMGNEPASVAEQAEAKRRLKASKVILDDPRLQAIHSHQEKIRGYVRDHFCLPCDVLKPGLYPLPAALIQDCDAYLEEQRAIREALIEEAIAALPQMIENARTALEPVGCFSPLDYPSAGKFRQQFAMDVDYRTFGVPGETLQSITPALRAKHEARFIKGMEEAQEEANAALRAAFAVLVSRMKESLEPGADGKKKKFHATTVDNLLGFITTFKERWAAAAGAGDDEISKLVTEVGSLLDGTDLKMFRNADTFRTEVREKFTAIADQLASLTEASGRAYSFDDDGEEAA